MIAFVAFVFVLLFLFIILYLDNKSHEHFGIQCQDESDTTDFCAWNVNDKTCYCTYQPGLTRTNFPQNPSCCDKSCAELSEEECNLMPNPQYNNIDYYCPIDGQCKKFIGKTVNNMISANTCGYDKLNYQTIYPFLTKSDCEEFLDPCGLNNNDNYSVSEQRNSCLNKEFCGWCTNDQGVGQCISGTASGPINIYKYNFCQLNNNGTTNSYIHKGPSYDS